MIPLKNISKIVLFGISFLLFGCTFNDYNLGEKAKYELYVKDRSRLAYTKIYDNFDIDDVKYIDYYQPFKLGTRDMEISNNGNMYQAICKNINLNRLLEKIYIVKGDKKIEEIDTPEVCPESLFIDNNILYVFYVAIFKGTRPDGGLLTIIDTNTNKVIDNKRIFGTIEDPPKVYKDKIYAIFKIANELGYKEYSDNYLVSIDRKTYNIERLYDIPWILDFDIYEDYIYMIRYVKISKEKELFYLVKTDMEGNEISQKKIDYDTTNIVIKDNGIAYFYNDFNESSIYIHDIKKEKLVKEIKDFGIVRNIEFIDNLLFVPAYKKNKILVINRDNFEIIKEIEFPDNINFSGIAIKKAE